MRVPIIAGNWKMFKDETEAFELATEIRKRLKDVSSKRIVLCPPFTSIPSVKKAIQGSSIYLGAQNMHWEEEGAYTGEISAKMLLGSGCSFVILGHSERRAHFGETDQVINKKIKKAIEEGLTPIVCVGEILEERESGKTESVVEEQIRGAFEGINKKEIEKLVIAYEPVWAIGTGKTATPKQANEVHRFIREKISLLFNQEIAQKVCILYGGSVKPENSKDLLAEPDIDGALVGGASLRADSFDQIVRSD
ncbi:MAG: triosephosphate isomerase [candidate division Zixibacteria bacterium SM23_73_2]|nr:MAG: triosephosphate isomerase [candidate division Zixibacteria bacterium SM23_73_2]